MDPSSAAARPRSRGLRHNPGQAFVMTRTRGRPGRIVYRVGPRQDPRCRSPRPMDLVGGGLRPWFGASREVHALVMAKVREARAAARRGRRAWLPPRWFVVLFWHGHRALVRATRGRLGLWRPKPDVWGALRLTTVGRHRAVAAGCRRLLRGRTQPDHDGDERVGCGRTGMVAEPAGSS